MFTGVFHIGCKNGFRQSLIWIWGYWSNMGPGAQKATEILTGGTQQVPSAPGPPVRPVRPPLWCFQCNQLGYEGSNECTAPFLQLPPLPAGSSSKTARPPRQTPKRSQAAQQAESLMITSEKGEVMALGSSKQWTMAWKTQW